MDQQIKKRSPIRTFIGGGIAGVFSAFVAIATHKLLSAVYRLSDTQAHFIAFGLALICVVLFVVLPILRRRRANR